MFVAQIIICGFLSFECVALEDMRKVSLSLQQCKNRQAEMFQDISREIPNVQLYNASCRKLDELYT